MSKIRFVRADREPTPLASELIGSLRGKGVHVDQEVSDGYKTVDLSMPKAKIDVEVDGSHHLTDPDQVIRDIKRGYHSYIDGYHTIHIPNEMLVKHLTDISRCLAEVSKRLEQGLSIHVN